AERPDLTLFAQRKQRLGVVEAFNAADRPADDVPEMRADAIAAVFTQGVTAGALPGDRFAGDRISGGDHRYEIGVVTTFGHFGVITAFGDCALWRQRGEIDDEVLAIFVIVDTAKRHRR